MVNTDATACVQVQTCKQTPWREGASARNFLEADLNENTDDDVAAEAHVDPQLTSGHSFPLTKNQTLKTSR